MTPNPGPEAKPYDIWKIPRRVLIPTGILVAVVALAYLEENIRGKHAWMKYRHELEAKGEKLDFKDFIPPSVPDDQNFAMTPLLAQLFEVKINPKTGVASIGDKDAIARVPLLTNGFLPEPPRFWDRRETPDLNEWLTLLTRVTNVPPYGQKEAASRLLGELGKFHSQFDELQKARTRKLAWYKVNYNLGMPFATPSPHLGGIRVLGSWFGIRALAELESGQFQPAAEDTSLVIFLASTLEKEPSTLGQFVRASILNVALERLWQGMARHNWTDSQIAEFQNEIGRIDFLKTYAWAMRAERAANLALIEHARMDPASPIVPFSHESPSIARYFPRGWFYQNNLTLGRLFDARAFSIIDAQAHRAFPERVIPEEDIRREDESGFYFYKMLAQSVFEQGEFHALRFAQTQARLEMAMVACALERYRLTNGRLPGTLNELKPAFLGQIPNDLITGNPLCYRIKEGGNFLLYSVGWNGKDDGGKVAAFAGKTANLDPKNGDWVWPEYPAK